MDVVLRDGAEAEARLWRVLDAIRVVGHADAFGEQDVAVTAHQRGPVEVGAQDLPELGGRVRRRGGHRRRGVRRRRGERLSVAARQGARR